MDEAIARESSIPHAVGDPKHARKHPAREPGYPVTALPEVPGGTCQEVQGRKLAMNGHGKSDRPMDKDMTLANGSKVMMDGTVMMKNGKKMMMKDGMCMDMSGAMMPANGIMMKEGMSMDMDGNMIRMEGMKKKSAKMKK